MTEAQYLILGNSVAAMACIEAIREHDPDTPITLIAREPHHTYSRPLITYLLGGLVDEERMYYRPRDYYEQAGVRAILGTEAVRVHPRAGCVETAIGDRVHFDNLLIATGGRPIVPPDVGGVELEGVFTFTTLDDARRISNHINAHAVRSALVVGGGLIGLKSVEALLELGLQVTVVELADRMLSATFDHTASELLQRRLSANGVQVLCNNTVSRIKGEDGRVAGAILRDGTELDCGLVIFAIGVLPDTRIVEGTEIAVDRGILVDRRMQTSVEGIYAAGDVAQAEELLCGEQRCIAIFPNAYRQGKVAGANMAGAEARWDGGLVMNSVAICGLPTISVGITTAPDASYQVYQSLDEDNWRYKKLVLRGDRIVGAIFVGQIDRAGIITGLIRGKVDVSSFRDQLMADDFGLLSLPTDYRKHIVSGAGIEV